MKIRSFIKKIQWYHNKYGGWGNLIMRVAVKGWSIIDKKEYIYLLDFNTLEVGNTLKHDGIVVESYYKISDIPANDMAQLIKLKSKEILLPFLNSFFNRSARLWIAKKDDGIASVIWTLNGGFNGFYMGIPICPNETIFLAGETFSEFRGHNYLAIVMILICEILKQSGIIRAYSGAHMKNKASQKAQSKIFKRIGAVRYFQLHNWQFVIWDKKYLMIDFK